MNTDEIRKYADALIKSQTNVTEHGRVYNGGFKDGVEFVLQKLNKHDVSGRSEQLVCEHPDEAMIKDRPTDYCMACGKNV